MIQELDVQKIRKDFPMLQNQNLIYLDSSATSQKPYSVIRAVTDFYENCNANPLRGLYETAQNATEKYEAAREKSPSVYSCKKHRRDYFYKKCNRKPESGCIQLWTDGISAGR